MYYIYLRFSGCVLDVPKMQSGGNLLRSTLDELASLEDLFRFREPLGEQELTILASKL